MAKNGGVGGTVRVIKTCSTCMKVLSTVQGSLILYVTSDIFILHIFLHITHVSFAASSRLTVNVTFCTNRDDA